MDIINSSKESLKACRSWVVYSSTYKLPVRNEIEISSGPLHTCDRMSFRCRRMLDLSASLNAPRGMLLVAHSSADANRLGSMDRMTCLVYCSLPSPVILMQNWRSCGMPLACTNLAMPFL